MIEFIQGAYLAITLAVFIFTVCTADRPYGRGVEDGVNWGCAFFVAMTWPVLLVLLGAILVAEMKTEDAK